MWAPVTSRIALMLLPPRPITREIKLGDTIMRLALKQEETIALSGECNEKGDNYDQNLCLF